MACNKPAARLFPLEPLLEAAGITAGQLSRLVKANGSAVHQAALHGLTVSEAAGGRSVLVFIPRPCGRSGSTSTPTTSRG